MSTGNPKVLYCNKCGRRFSGALRLWNRLQHMRTEHGSPS